MKKLTDKYSKHSLSKAARFLISMVVVAGFAVAIISSNKSAETLQEAHRAFETKKQALVKRTQRSFRLDDQIIFNQGNELVTVRTQLDDADREIERLETQVNNLTVLIREVVKDYSTAIKSTCLEY